VVKYFSRGYAIVCPMKIYNLCILGFGNIGRALAELLQEKADELRAAYGIEWRITGVATRRLGWLADANGLDVHALLQGQSLSEPGQAKPRNVYEWLAAAQADVLFELTSLDVQTGQPAIEHIRAALERGAHAVTANKGPIVHAYAELKALADARHARFLFDAAVMGGAPSSHSSSRRCPLPACCASVASSIPPRISYSRRWSGAEASMRR
jgi:homoserine dehydrogenase